VVLGGALGVSSMAQAGPTLDLKFPSVPTLFPAGSDTVKIQYNNGTSSYNGTVYAGMFGGEATGSTDFNPETLYQSESNVLVYCVDIFDNLIKSNSTYDVRDVAPDQVVFGGDNSDIRRDFGRTLNFLGALNSVLSSDYGLNFGDKNWLNPALTSTQSSPSGWMAGAIQVGIWESLYEKAEGPLKIDDGWFKVAGIGTGNHNLSTDGSALLSTVFGMMDSFPPLDATVVKWLESADGQDLIADPLPVPAPGTIALLAAGLGLALRRRRRSSP
jgi:hypothetical protein